MHLLVRETRSLDDAEPARDLGQSAADLVLLSFSDSDLGAAAAAWQAHGALPSLRLANLARLRHPLSVDLYVEQVIAQSRCVVVRLLGGLDYWRYGAEEVAAAARKGGIALALLPGDGRADERLAQLSTVGRAALARLDACLAQGGAVNLQRALELAAHLAGLGPDRGLQPVSVPAYGVYDTGIADRPGRPLAAVVFYRSHMLAGDTAPIDALARALDARGLNIHALHVGSLKEADAAKFVARSLRDRQPAVVVNATAFSARLDDGDSPLDAAGVPVLQLVLAGSDRAAWAASARGLAAADLAMHVVLPEFDGRLMTTAVSFKSEEPPVAGLEFARVVHRPDCAGIDLAADRAAAWARLAATPRAARRLALMLSDYPGAAGQAAHAVGLDAIASAEEIVGLLGREGFDVGSGTPVAAEIVTRLCETEPTPFMALADYELLFAELPQDLRARVTGAWDGPRADPALREEHFAVRLARFGKLVAAIQPERGNVLERKADYHNPDLPPRHGYVAFYLWLREVERVHALIHLGTHGTLEWLPGKAVALSATCAPLALLGSTPVVYPFIVNNPGEAAAAKRRLGAVTIGHLTPPLRSAGVHGAVRELERLIDEYAAADGLDSRRTAILRNDILQRAGATGLLEECGAAADMSEDDRLARLDAYLCDVKDLQIRDGLHVFGRAPQSARREAFLASVAGAADGSTRGEGALRPANVAAGYDACAGAERAALVAALDGRFVAPGPAGAPSRGRADVLPTGRNLFTVDPRAVPNRSALVLAEKAASEFMRRYMQDHGEPPRRLVLDLWGSATMRTGGEDLAMALILMGARPVWDEGSARVSGIEVMPVAAIEHPRVDVTLRISGLFRDTFEAQIALFDEAVRAIAARTEEGEWNPLAASVGGLAGEDLRRATMRVYGAAPGAYGAGIEDLIAKGTWRTRAELGADYLAASSTAYGQGVDGRTDGEGFARRVRLADAFLHQQDHAEVDLLDSLDYAAHEGGFAAAADMLGGAPALYHGDASRPGRPVMRTLAREVARIVRGRAANPAWIAGMMPHGYRGAAEIARGVEGLFAFAATLPGRLDRQFDLLFDATLGDERVDAFLREANPAARGAMAARFSEAMRRDLWRPRRNAVADLLAGARP